MFVSDFRPTIMRANASMTNATKQNPDQVRTLVKSATHSSYGAVAVNARASSNTGLRTRYALVSRSTTSG